MRRVIDKSEWMFVVIALLVFFVEAWCAVSAWHTSHILSVVAVMVALLAGFLVYLALVD